MSRAKSNNNTNVLGAFKEKLNNAYSSIPGGWPALMGYVIKIAQEHSDLSYSDNNDNQYSFYQYIHDKHDNYLRDISQGKSGNTFNPSLIAALEFCITKVPNYFEAEKERNEEKYANPLAKIKDPVRREFYQSLQTKMKGALNMRKPLDFLNAYTKDQHIRKDELLEFVVGNPTLLFAFLDDGYSAIKEGSKDVPLVSKVYHFNTEIETDLFVEVTEDFDDYFNGGKDYDKKIRTVFSKSNGNPGLFLGQALSPYSDSICLLYELGRFMRVSEIFGFPNPKIFLTAPSWAKYNRSAIEIHSDESKRENVLKQCLAFREKLYKQLGIEVDKSEDTDIISAGQKPINHSKIKKSAQEFAKYSQHINEIKVDFGRDKNKQLLEIIENLCSPDNSDSYIDRLPSELKVLAYSIVDDKKNLFVIHTILRHFNSLDENTFYYTLLQRYKQQQFNGWVKLAVESERKFDASFSKLDKVDGIDESNIGAVYFKHYYFRRGKDGSPLNVIPYTFPSGRLWRRSEGNLQFAIDNTILLWDFENDRREKIKGIIAEIDLKQLAIQMSDLLSFCNYFFFTDETFWTGKIDKNGIHQSGLNDFLKELDGSCTTAWSKYRKDPELLKTFSQYFLTMWYADVELPYFFYPFLHIQKAEKDTEYEKRVREFYAEIIIYSLTQLNKKIPCSEWK